MISRRVPPALPGPGGGAAMAAKVAEESREGRSAQLRQLGFAATIGGGAAGTAARIGIEGLNHYNPALGRKAGKLLLPITMMGVGAGISDKKSELALAARNLTARTGSAVRSLSGTPAAMEGGVRSAAPGRSHSAEGEGKTGSAPAEEGYKLAGMGAASYDTLDRVGEMCWANYRAFQKAALHQLPDIFTTAEKASVDNLRPRFAPNGFADGVDERLGMTRTVRPLR